MKVVYSLILLFSFLIGTLQPILPAIDYQLNRGNIFELLDSGECDSEQSDILINYNDCESEDDSDQNLLDIDYYPLALQLSAISKPISFPHKSRIYISLRENILSLSFLPNPPPPRLS